MSCGQEPAFQILKLPHREHQPGAQVWRPLGRLLRTTIVGDRAKARSYRMRLCLIPPWSMLKDSLGPYEQSQVGEPGTGDNNALHTGQFLFSSLVLLSTDKLRAGVHSETDTFRVRHAPGTPTWPRIYLRHHRKEFSVTQGVGVVA